MTAAAEDHSTGRWGRWIWFCVAVGVGLRIAQWWAGQPIWHDEWMLLWNVEHKTARGLMGALDMNQAAPPAFLAALRGLYVAFGESPLALRTPSLVAGCGMLALLAAVARRTVGGAGAVAAVAAVALSDRMIWHSTEIKPYAIDALVAVGLIWAALCLQGRLRWIAVASIGAAGMWVSYATPFVLAAVMGTLGLQARRERNQRRWWAACATVAGLSLAAVYWLVARHQRTPGLAAAWDGDYVPWRGAWWVVPLWWGRKTLELCGYAAENAGPIVLALAAAGAITWTRRPEPPGPDPACPRKEWPALGVLLGPVAVVLIAAGARLYPYGGSRATLFLMPGIFLLMGAGIDATRRGLVPSPWLTRWWWLPAAAVLGAMAVPAAYHLAVPRVRTPEVEQLVAFVEAHRHAGDDIYVASHDGWPAEFVSYWRTKGRQVQPLEKATPTPPAPGRFWVVATFKHPAEFDTWVRELNPTRLGMEQRDRLALKHGAAVLFVPKDLTAGS